MRLVESQPESSPTLCKYPKHQGSGRALIAYGIKLSVDVVSTAMWLWTQKRRSLQSIMSRILARCQFPGVKPAALHDIWFVMKLPEVFLYLNLEEDWRWKTRSGILHMKQKKIACINCERCRKTKCDDTTRSWFFWRGSNPPSSSFIATPTFFVIL